MSNFYHVCTEGLKNELVFKDDGDFVFGMNGIAIYAYKYPVKVLAFCLMDNHVHFVLEGNEESCGQFIKAYQLRLSRISNALKADISIKAVGDIQYLKRVIGYVLRNPVQANIQLTPANYPWSSGALYFQNADYFNRVSNDCTKVGDITPTRLRNCLRTKEPIPDDCLIDARGMVLPECYVCIKDVENIFCSVKEFLFFLSKNDDMEMELTSTTLPKCRYTDGQLYASMTEICRKEFRVTGPDRLSVENLHKLAVILRKRYRTGVKQLARITGLSLSILKAVLPDAR